MGGTAGRLREPERGSASATLGPGSHLYGRLSRGQVPFLTRRRPTMLPRRRCASGFLQAKRPLPSNYGGSDRYRGRRAHAHWPRRTIPEQGAASTAARHTCAGQASPQPSCAPGAPEQPLPVWPPTRSGQSARESDETQIAQHRSRPPTRLPPMLRRPQEHEIVHSHQTPVVAETVVARRQKRSCCNQSRRADPKRTSTDPGTRHPPPACLLQDE